MASLRNAEKRRSHRERAQPKKRRRLGLLEKHSDYVKRARNYASKKQRISALWKKAADRNPDEFNFGMLNSKTKGGVHQLSDGIKRGKLSAEMHMLIKTQDVTYATLAESREKKKIKKLQANLHCLSSKKDGATSKHTIFVDSVSEAKNFNAAAHFDTAPELAHRSFNRPRIETLKESKCTTALPGTKAFTKMSKQRERAYNELKERIKRGKKLGVLRSHLQGQKNLMGKGTRRKVKDAKNGMPAVYKWKAQRKR